MKKCVSMIIILLFALSLVSCKAVESIELSLPSTTMDKGTTAALAATVLPEEASDKTLTYASSDETIITVAEDGSVTAVAVGVATITATAKSGIEATIEITVVQPVTSLECDSEVTVALGLWQQLNVTCLPEDATDKTLTYASADTSIATVDEGGIISGLQGGETTVTVTAASGVKAEIKVTVKYVVEKIALNYGTIYLAPGGSATLIATISPSEAAEEKLTFESNLPNIATVDENGVVRAVSVGNAVVTVTAESGIYAHCNVVVSASGGGGGGGGVNLNEAIAGATAYALSLGYLVSNSPGGASFNAPVNPSTGLTQAQTNAHAIESVQIVHNMFVGSGAFVAGVITLYIYESGGCIYTAW